MKKRNFIVGLTLMALFTLAFGFRTEAACGLNPDDPNGRCRPLNKILIGPDGPTLEIIGYYCSDNVGQAPNVMRDCRLR